MITLRRTKPDPDCALAKAHGRRVGIRDFLLSVACLVIPHLKSSCSVEIILCVGQYRDCLRILRIFCWLAGLFESCLNKTSRRLRCKSVILDLRTIRRTNLRFRLMYALRVLTIVLPSVKAVSVLGCQEMSETSAPSPNKMLSNPRSIVWTRGTNISGSGQEDQIETPSSKMCHFLMLNNRTPKG